jgi:hypothetical protein
MNHKKRTRETHQGTGKPGYRLALMPAMLMAALGCANTAWAVDGGVVAAGAGAIKTQGNKTTISQSSDKMIVNRVAAQLSYAMRAGHPLAQTARQQTWVTVSTVF